MALTVGEAQAICDLLGFLFAVPSPDGSPPEPVRALNGAEFLADRAFQVRHTGIRAEQIQAGWRRLEQYVALTATGHDLIRGVHDAAPRPGGGR